MSPHIYIIFLSKPAKRDRKEKGKGIIWVNKKVNKRHMKTKCPKQLVHLPKEEEHQYVPHLNMKPLSKNAWQSPKKPLTNPKCLSHLWPKCNLEESLCLNIHEGFQNLHFNTLTLSPIRNNWVERWSKVRIISLIKLNYNSWFFLLGFLIKKYPKMTCVKNTTMSI
jgi:hypothetical protein